MKNSYRSGGNKYDRYANRDLNGSVEILHGHSNGAHTTTKVVYNGNQESRGARRSLPTDRSDRIDDNETNTSHQRGGKSRVSHSRYDSKRHNDVANDGQDDRQGELLINSIDRKTERKNTLLSIKLFMIASMNESKSLPRTVVIISRPTRFPLINSPNKSKADCIDCAAVACIGLRFSLFILFLSSSHFFESDRIALVICVRSPQRVRNNCSWLPLPRKKDSKQQDNQKR